MYKYFCIEESRIGKLWQTRIVMIVHTVTPVMMTIVILTINLDKRGIEKLFQTSKEVIIMGLRVYTEDWENLV